MIPLVHLKRYSNLLVVLLLLAAIPLTVKLATSTQNIGKKAAETVAPTGLPLKGDLDVTYISRLPRLPRYSVTYNSNGPTGYTGGQWPTVGQAVTYKAVIKNVGTLSSSSYSGQWIIDGNVVLATTSGSLGPDAIGEQQYTTTWDNQEHTILFQVNPSDTNAERSLVNNTRSIYSKALSFRFHIEPSVYQLFKTVVNMKGTQSFEDWAQAQIDQMNMLFAEASSNEHVFLDEIIIEDNLPGNGEHAPLDIEWDGRWGFDNLEWTQSKIQNEAPAIQNSLIHELTHQLGIIDEYNFNFDPNYITQNLVNGQTYRIPYDGLMNETNTLHYSEHTQLGLKSNKGFRRGYFGEYLYDIPQTNKVTFTNLNNNPLKNVTIKMYQKTNDNWIYTIPTITGITDANGSFVLPNRPVTTVSSATGHILKPNPFGQLSVVGGDGLFLVEVTANGQKYYDWLSIYRFNIEYWKGNKTNAVYTMKFNVPTPTPSPLCQDSDGGNIPTVKGTVTHCPVGFNCAYYNDYCTSATEQSEMICTSEGMKSIVHNICTGQCVDGICVQSPTKTPTPTRTPTPKPPTATPTRTPTPSPIIPIVNSAVTIKTTTGTVTSRVVPNGTTQYKIEFSTTDNSNQGINGIREQLLLVNHQGVSAGQYRGYLGWSHLGKFKYFGTSVAQVKTCNGNGVGKAALYGANYGKTTYITLRGCTNAVVGKVRYVTFTVSFNTAFTSPINNIMSVFAEDFLPHQSGWSPKGSFTITP